MSFFTLFVILRLEKWRTEMKRLHIKIRKISLRITLYFSILLIFIAAVITILNISLYSDELSNQMATVVDQKLSLITGKLNENINNIKLIHTVMLSDSSINFAFSNVVEEANETNIQVLARLLDNHHSTSSDRKSVIALGVDGQIYHPSSNYSSYQSLTQGNEDFNISKTKRQYFRFTVPNTFPLEYANPTMTQRQNITLYAQYFDYDSMTHLGYLAIYFRKNDLFANIDTLVNETFASMYIVNEYDELIHQYGEIPYESIPKSLTNKDLTTISDHEYSVLTTTLDSYERWRIISLFDRDLVKRETSRLNQFIYLTIVVALILMLFISWFISQSITNPIREMIHSMGEFDKGQWPEPLITKNEDEIKDLIEGYNRMLTSFIKLTDDMIGRQQENQMIELDLIKTQLGLLEAQINPHFIHNTLNSMNYLALSSGNHGLSEVIESFNKLLRMSMAIDVSFITVGQELENIKDYVRIQKVRFDDVFDLKFDVDDDTMIAKIPKLILQPIVENSIIHGILAKEENGTITITIKRFDDDLRISIMDDGIGIQDQNMKSLLRKDKRGPISKHIGVQNVYDRLKLYYGEDINFTINSTLNQGTVTTLFIPYED